MTAFLLDAWQDMHCPECGFTEQVKPPLAPGASRMHPCPKLHGLTAPLVPVGSDCRLIAVQRQDYLGTEIQRTGDDGRPYMAVVTERADGSNDAHVFAGCAYAAVERR